MQGLTPLEGDGNSLWFLSFRCVRDTHTKWPDGGCVFPTSSDVSEFLRLPVICQSPHGIGCGEDGCLGVVRQRLDDGNDFRRLMAICQMSHGIGCGKDGCLGVVRQRLDEGDDFRRLPAVMCQMSHDIGCGEDGCLGVVRQRLDEGNDFRRLSVIYQTPHGIGRREQVFYFQGISRL